MLVYAGVNCFEDRNETKEKFRVVNYLLYVVEFFVSFISKFYFSKKVQFRFTSPTGQIKTVQVWLRFLQVSSEDSSNILRFDLDFQQTFQDMSLSFF